MRSTAWNDPRTRSHPVLRARAETRSADLRLVLPAVTGGLLAAQAALIAWRLGGHFSYTLDDPYIHLALADQIAVGHYGLSPGVAAAPSSSILYPFLLAALGVTGAGPWAPLLVNAAAALACGWLLARLIGDVFPTARWRLGPALVLAAAAALGLNLVGLALTGMEHTLQVAVTLAWVLGAMRFLRDRVVVPWWWVCGLAEPLIRYEGAVLWLATLVMMAWHGRRRAGLALLMSGLALLGGFSAFLHGLGLGLLPSSVLVKSQLTNAGEAMAATDALGHVIRTVTTNLLAGEARLLCATTMALLLVVERHRRSRAGADRTVTILALVAITAGVAQVTLGRVDFQGRYTAYVLALHICVLMAGFAPAIGRLTPRLPWPAWAAVVAAASLCFSPYTARSLRADLGARDIFEQQYQMHRMAVDLYRGAVAVNDLGWVSYRNPYPVLDLWGLGSEEARRARAADPSGRWLDAIVRRHDVGLVMIYDRWFPVRPARWVAVARLRLDHDVVTAGEDTVTFYATAPDRIAAVRSATDRLAADLPLGARLDILSSVKDETALPSP